MPSYALYSGTTFKIPQDCVAITIECIGAGSTGGTGGAYSKTNRISVSRGQTIYINVGSSGGDTWVNVNGNSQPSTTSDGCLALGGNTAASSQIAGGVGDVKYRGGSAGGLSGGGAAGPAGNGGNGSFSSPYYIGGSANNGGASANTTNPATLTLGVLSQFGVDYASRSYGSYSGSPAWDDGGGGGTNQGMGGGGAAQSYINGPGGGLVVISFSSYPVSGTYSEQFFVNDNSRSPFRFPKCTITVNRILGVGAGSPGMGGSWPTNGGGGGGYAASSYNLNTKRNLLMYYNVAPASGVYSGGTSNTWANITSNAEPTSSAQGIRAASAYAKYYGGFYCSNIGNSVTYVGGYGGCGVQVYSASRRGGGGGAAGGPYGAGGSGGNGYSITSATASGAGGGGGGVNYFGLTAAGNGTSTTGGKGGYSAQGTGGAGGSNGATTTGGGAGSSGGGGGGSGYRANSTLYGGAGSSAFFIGYNITFGSGGGGGGSNTTNSAGVGGGGGSYGGGGGGGCASGAGTSGAICIQYTVAVRGSLHGFFT